jgi:hypothetical protein
MHVDIKTKKETKKKQESLYSLHLTGKWLLYLLIRHPSPSLPLLSTPLPFPSIPLSSLQFPAMFPLDR